MPNYLPLGLTAPASLASGNFSQRLFAVGSYTQTLGVASLVVSVPGMLSTANVFLTVNQVDVTMLTATAVPAVGQFTSTGVAPTAGCKVSYMVFQ